MIKTKFLGATRGFVTAHAVAIFGQPVFAGSYLTGDYGMLAVHRFGANLVFSLALAQLVPTALLWRRGGPRWPFWASVLLLLGETAQYFAGLAGALGLHVPLGVALVSLAVVTLVGIWR
ncbi:hypothetical protein [Amycolatopsis nalaikhensis]|uniref:Uncharacterized protein n=1 Tax=Amycolatopsis nalaikhensis TaxID=715472 RepID=A0ABY8Y0B8_9PSEU|nr:hypothetical protein [Amycolatopsis sp. 2-2]WIV61308.1 hypothetical protein QP939_23240 [Amycolatopsis sp. 2-2]